MYIFSSALLNVTVTWCQRRGPLKDVSLHNVKNLVIKYDFSVFICTKISLILIMLFEYLHDVTLPKQFTSLAIPR